MPIVRVRRGQAPLLLSVPHAGTDVPDAIAARFTPEARALPDTDWHVDRLYDFADALDATLLVATCSRYVVDVNRPPDDASLYPGQQGTGLVPHTTFAGAPIYAGPPPSADEVAARIANFWRPYHDALGTELVRLRARHGAILLWDAHSIASRVPWLFEGELPHLNVGTAGGRSCAPTVRAAVAAEAHASAGYEAVVDARFRGGYITRAYGAPDRGVHAVQLELAQRAYMDEATGGFDEPRAAALRPRLRAMLAAALGAVAALSGA